MERKVKERMLELDANSASERVKAVRASIATYSSDKAELEDRIRRVRIQVRQAKNREEDASQLQKLYNKLQSKMEKSVGDFVDVLSSRPDVCITGRSSGHTITIPKSSAEV